MREQRKSTQNSAHTEVPVNVITCGGKKAVGKHIANPQGLMKTPSPFLFLVMALEIRKMRLPHLFLPSSFSPRQGSSHLCFLGFGGLCLPGQLNLRVAKVRVGEGRGELRIQPALRSGEATGRRWWGGRSRPKGGEEGRRRTRVPGLVTAGGPGIRHPDSLGEMAGGGDRRVVGTLHLLLVVAALPLAIPGVSRGAAAWTQEKVRGCCCQFVPG